MRFTQTFLALLLFGVSFGYVEAAVVVLFPGTPQAGTTRPNFARGR